MPKGKRKRGKPAATSKKPRTRSSNKMPTATELAQLSDQKLEDLLRELLAKGKDESKAERIAYAKLLHGAVGSMLGNEEYTSEEHTRVSEWSKKFASGQLLPVEVSPLTLGCQVSSLGYGSKAKIHRSEIENQATSCYDDDDDYKGLTLAHFFYRRFLKHIYGTLAPGGHNDGEAPEFPCDKDLKDEKEEFRQSYSRIFQQTKEGVVTAKTKEGFTHEACATSLLSSYINHSIRSVVGNAGMVPSWCAEYTLFGSGEPITRRDPTSSKKGKQQEEGDKQPRCDGLLTMPDPMSQESLRALVMMEAKLNEFDNGDDLQSVSNACDAISRQPKGQIPWPLLLFRWVIRDKSCHVKVLSMVPVGPKKLRVVSLWDGDHFTDSLFRSVMAAVYAAIDFRKELQRQKNQLLFCQVIRNVAVQCRRGKNEPDCVYKSFFNTDDREVNLPLVQKHVDPDAEEVRISEGRVWLKTKYVAHVLPKNLECAVERFIEVANTLGQAHGDNYCHGDVRLDNMILGGQRGTLIDWDLAGEEGIRKYPKGLQPIVDGARHRDVLNAIDSGTIGMLSLSKDHDWFSLQAVMKLFRPKDCSNASAWEGLVDIIENQEERNAARNSFSVVLDKQKLKRAGGIVANRR